MRHIFIIILSLSLFTAANGQSAAVDSIIDAAISWRNYGNSDLVVRELNTLVSSVRTSDRAYYELGYTHLVNGNYTLAMLNAKRAVDLKGDYKVNAQLVLSQCYIARGELNRAMRLLKSLPKDDAEVLYNMAVIYYRNKKLDEAETYVQKAINDDKGMADAHLLLSYIMLDKGERLKSMLPLYYYLLLNNEGDDARDAFKQLNGMWAVGGRHIIGRIKKDVKPGFYRNADIKIEEFAKSVSEEKDDLKKLMSLTSQLFQYLKDESGDNFDFYQITYSDFFIVMHNNEFSEPFACFLCYDVWKPQVIRWITDNGFRFNDFRVWMESY